MRGWKIPFTANIPIEKEIEFNEKIKTELVYEAQKEKRISTTFNNLNSNLRKVADYFWRHQSDDEICLATMSSDLNIPINSIKQLIGDLNFFNGFSMTIIPVRKKTGYVQTTLKNQDDYENWDRKKMKTITSMVRVKDKAEKITSSKRRARRKIAVTNETQMPQM